MIELVAPVALKAQAGLHWLDWLIVAGVAGAVSAVTIVQETRTTSLLLSRWAAFLAALVILLDVAAAELVAVFSSQLLSLEHTRRLIAFIGIAAAAPTMLPGLKVTIAKTSVGPFRPYEILRGALLIRLDDEFGTHMEMKARLLAGKAYEYEVDPEDLARVMVALVRRKKVSSETKSQIGHVLGALQTGGVQDQMERLVELMYEYRMRSLIRCIETGTITALLTPPRPVCVASPVDEVARKERHSPRKRQTGKAARHRTSPPDPADADSRATGRNGHREQEQGPPGS